MSAGLQDCIWSPTVWDRIRSAGRRVRLTVRYKLRDALFRAALRFEEDGNLEHHAKRELQASGYKLDETEEGPNKWIVQNVLDLLRVFSMQGHSGFSAPYCVSMFEQLAKFQPLGPLTGVDSEWNEVSDNTYQNKRCSHVFKNGSDGQAYDINGRVFREPSGACYTNGDSRVFVTFPYTPVREYVDVSESKE